MTNEYKQMISCALCESALYYASVKEYDEMKIYYNMAIELNNRDALLNLSNYYIRIEKNYVLSVKYYKMYILSESGDYESKITEYINSLDCSEQEKYFLLSTINKK